MGQLANCPRCDALFVSGMRSICQECYKEEERAYTTVYNYLRPRKNRQATIPEIVEATGVHEGLIYKFVKEKRLRASQFPNLSYPCDRCGTEIAEGNLCKNCSADITGALSEQQKINDIEKRNKEKEQANTYYTVEKKH
ncbi:TIGR03826 family flagellar region protein [Sediminibacillus albus]|uniref:Flagellar operon protein TIGR03826 n=1 Tax=Sediminibacillus albus TaxID=407036 RepID=A0A1G8YP03_9BACI|nr:TIGR03826 family flagellar region protein [Sediminibacillus albus]SDK03825.1 flagellar operon protein TIGR03826 [Sediminibacillus albus]